MKIKKKYKCREFRCFQSQVCFYSAVFWMHFAGSGSHQRMPRPIWICMHRYNFDHNSGGSQLNIFVCRHIEKSCCSAFSLTVTPLLKSSRRNKNQITTFLTFVSHTRTHAHIEIKTDMHITTTLRLSPTKIFDAGFSLRSKLRYRHTHA